MRTLPPLVGDVVRKHTSLATREAKVGSLSFLFASHLERLPTWSRRSSPVSPTDNLLPAYFHFDSSIIRQKFGIDRVRSYSVVSQSSDRSLP